MLRKLFAGVTIVEPQVAVLNEGVGRPAFRIFLSDNRTRAMGKKKKA